MFDVSVIKKTFPFFEKNKDLVYLDSAATALKPQEVITAITNYYQNFCTTTHSIDHDLGFAGSKIVQETRFLTAQFIGAQNSEEIIFCSSATFGLNQIFYGLSDQIQPNDEILTTELEHSSLLGPALRLKEQQAAKLMFLPLTQTGSIDLKSLEAKLSPKTKIVAFSIINNSVAEVNDIQNIVTCIRTYEKKHQRKIYVVIDGTQSIAHIKTDVTKWDIDFFTFSAHKIFGPTGIGCLWGKMTYLKLLKPLLLGGGNIQTISEKANNKYCYTEVPHCFEAGTPNMAGIFGLNAAIKFMNKFNFDDIMTHELQLKTYAIAEIQKLFGTEVIFYNAQTKVGILLFNLKNNASEDINTFLGNNGICARSGNFCVKLGHLFLKTHSSLRFTFSIYNDKMDIDKLVTALKTGKEQVGGFLGGFI